MSKVGLYGQLSLLLSVFPGGHLPMTPYRMSSFHRSVCLEHAEFQCCGNIMIPWCCTLVSSSLNYTFPEDHLGARRGLRKCSNSGSRYQARVTDVNHVRFLFWLTTSRSHRAGSGKRLGTVQHHHASPLMFWANICWTRLRAKLWPCAMWGSYYVFEVPGAEQTSGH